MILGVVTNTGVPQVRLRCGGEEWIAIIDSGFNGDLELPISLKSRITAQFVGMVESALAAGQTIVESCYLIDFDFDGESRRVEATFSEACEILVGTGMLTNHVLTIDFPARGVHLERTVNSE